MARSLLIVLVLVVGVVGLGPCTGAGSSSRRRHTGETSNVTLTLDQDKMHQDKDQAIQKVRDLGHKVGNTVAAATQKSDDQVAPPPPQN